MRPGHSLKLLFPLGISVARFVQTGCVQNGTNRTARMYSKANFISAAGIDNRV
jgi:hypothetical protein